MALLEIQDRSTQMMMEMEMSVILMTMGMESLIYTTNVHYYIGDTIIRT